MSGYTLIEMLIVMVITTMTMLAIASASLLFYRTNRATISQAYAVENAREGMEKIVGDIRGVQYGADGSYPLGTTTQNTLIMYTDTNGDGITERVTYDLEGTDLKRGVASVSGNPPSYGAAATNTVSYDVQNAALGTPVFRYFATTSREVQDVSTSSPVGYIQIELLIKDAAATTSGTFTLRGAAALRNAAQF